MTCDRSYRLCSIRHMTGIMSSQPFLCLFLFCYSKIAKRQMSTQRRTAQQELRHNRLHRFITVDALNESCPICQEDLRRFSFSKKLLLGCDHEVCFRCWTNWYLHNHFQAVLCPLCKKDNTDIVPIPPPVSRGDQKLVLNCNHEICLPCWTAWYLRNHYQPVLCPECNEDNTDVVPTLPQPEFIDLTQD